MCGRPPWVYIYVRGDVSQDGQRRRGRVTRRLTVTIVQVHTTRGRFGFICLNRPSGVSIDHPRIDREPNRPHGHKLVANGLQVIDYEYNELRIILIGHLRKVDWGND